MSAPRTVLVPDARGRPKRVGENGILMVVGAPNSPKASKPSKAKVAVNRKRFKEYTVPLREVSDLPDIDEAIIRYQRFHGSQPTRARIFEYEDGADETRVLFRVGTPEIEIDTVEDAKGNEVRIKPLRIGTTYSVSNDKKSNKHGSQWVHSYREDGGKPPVSAVDVKTNVEHRLGGTIEFEDWARR